MLGTQSVCEAVGIAGREELAEQHEAYKGTDVGHHGGTPIDGTSALRECINHADGSFEYDIELLISFGWKDLAFAGRIALCVRGEPDEHGHCEETVYSANFYADGQHDASTHCIAPLMLRLPKAILSELHGKMKKRLKPRVKLNRRSIYLASRRFQTPYQRLAPTSGKYIR